jgi:hypothetical protein
MIEVWLALRFAAWMMRSRNTFASAVRHGRSMEEEAREILTVALAVRESIEPNWVESFRRRFSSIGGVEFPDLPREPMREAPDFGE